MRSDKERLEDILYSIDRIQSYLKENSSDGKTEDAIAYRIQVIGECARHVSEMLRNRYHEIPWKNIIGMRNILVHEYFMVDGGTVFDVAEHKIPALKDWIEGILNQMKGSYG